VGAHSTTKGGWGTVHNRKGSGEGGERRILGGQGNRTSLTENMGLVRHRMRVTLFKEETKKKKKDDLPGVSRPIKKTVGGQGGGLDFSMDITVNGEKSIG